VEGQSGWTTCPHPHTDFHYQICMLSVLGFCITNPEDTVSDVRRNAATPYAQWMCQDTEIRCCAVYRTRKSAVAQYTEHENPSLRSIQNTKIQRERYSRREIPEIYCTTGCSGNWFRNVGLPVLRDDVGSVQLEQHENLH
jgi:hypothetical protein